MTSRTSKLTEVDPSTRMADPGGGKSKKGTPGGRKDVGIQVNLTDKSKKGKCRTCCSLTLWSSAVIVAVLATLPVWNSAMVIIQQTWLGSRFVVEQEMMEDLGMAGVILFKQHDRDDDGKLSLEEFEPIAHRLLQANESITYDLHIEEWDELITIESHFKPILLETMSKTHDEIMSSEPLSAFHGLKYWKKCIKEWQNFGATHFSPFMPEDPHALESVGEPYWLILPTGTVSEGLSLSSNRYLPPPLVRGQDIMIHRLLAMFHERPFVYSRFAPQGAVAIVRAQNKKYVDIMFRIHAEFQLNEPPFFPYWFTPAQFTGHIIMSKDQTKVLYFHLYVPNNKRLNVDMEWLNAPKAEENMEVDIGYMPQMELKSTRTSVHVMFGGTDNRETFQASPEDYEASVQRVDWDEEITEKQAARMLEVELYPFKKVTYYNFTDVYPVAKQELKPVHSILLWGALDDQSC